MVTPTAETIFTSEYWEPIPPMQERKGRTTVGQAFSYLKEHRQSQPVPQFDREAQKIGKELLCYTVGQLAAGEPVESIGEGEQIEGDQDTSYALPGAVLLIDRERITFSSLPPVNVKEKNSIQDETELTISGVQAFLSGLRQTRYNDPKDNYYVLNPYRKSLHKPGSGTYEREVDMVAYCLNIRNETASIRLMQWHNVPESPYVVAPTSSSRLIGFLFGSWDPPSRVMETQNYTIGVESPMYSRIRGAYVCFRGTTEYAKAKSTLRRKPHFLPLLNRA